MTLPKDIIYDCGCQMKYFQFEPPEHLKYVWFARYYGEFVKNPNCETHGGK